MRLVGVVQGRHINVSGPVLETSGFAPSRYRGGGNGYAPSKHPCILYFDDFYIDFAKNLTKLLKNPQIF